MTTKEWTGTPAEWDAERERIFAALYAAAKVFYKWETTQPLRKDFFDALADAMMPPRPVETPSVVTASGWTVTWDGAQFKATKPSNPTNYGINPLWVAGWTSATEAEYAKIVALRDGPAPRYEVCGWGVMYKDGPLNDLWTSGFRPLNECEFEARRKAARIGGTAHAIYRRVDEGAK